MNKPIEVVAAILKANNKVLIGKRMKNDSNAGKWEFPGGKIDSGETPEGALRREIWEELGIVLEDIEFFDQIQFDYPGYSVNIRFYLSDVENDVKLIQDSHDELVWIEPRNYDKYDFLEANKVMLKKLAEIFQ